MLEPAAENAIWTVYSICSQKTVSRNSSQKHFLEVYIFQHQWIRLLLNSKKRSFKMKNSTHYIKTSFRHDDYLKDILERAGKLTKLSQSELIRNAYLGQYVPMLQTASVLNSK